MEQLNLLTLRMTWTAISYIWFHYIYLNLNAFTITRSEWCLGLFCFVFHRLPGVLWWTSLASVPDKRTGLHQWSTAGALIYWNEKSLIIIVIGERPGQANRPPSMVNSWCLYLLEWTESRNDHHWQDTWTNEPAHINCPLLKCWCPYLLNSQAPL